MDAVFGGDATRVRDVRLLLERAVYSSSNGIIITDPTRTDNPIVYVNPGFYEISGYSPEEALGRNCRFLQADDRDQPAVAELREAIRTGREVQVVVRNYRKDGAPFWNELHVSPVYGPEGNVVNFVGIQNDVTEQKKAEDERDMLLLGEQAAREEAEASRRRFELLSTAGATLSASLDYSTTLARVARLAVPELADWCLVDVLGEDDGIEQLAAAHADPSRESLLFELREHRQLDLEGPTNVARVLRTGEPAFASRTTEEVIFGKAGEGEHTRLLRMLEPRAYICVPLLARGRTLGAITFVSSTRNYEEVDLSLARELAARCALAVDNARLYRERGEIARTLQRGLLPPRLPEVPGLEVGLRYLPAGEVDVGGDFYDFFSTGDAADGSASWSVIIGDVSGKGAEAASITALARYTIRAVSVHKSACVEMLSDLNEAMIQQVEGRKFCTVACLRLKMDGTAETGASVSVIRAGHPPPLVLRSSGTVEKVGHPGQAIGIFRTPRFVEREVHLDPGDAIVLYTDGVTEARLPGGDFYGEERLFSILAGSVGLRADAIAARIERSIFDFQRGDLRDDVAILVLRIPEQKA